MLIIFISSEKAAHIQNDSTEGVDGSLPEGKLLDPSAERPAQRKRKADKMVDPMDKVSAASIKSCISWYYVCSLL